MALPSFPDFQARVHDSLAWYLQAELLRGAAFHLWDVGKEMMASLCSAGKGSRRLRMGETPPDPAFLASAHSSAFLVYGFAMENLIKALIVKKDPCLPRIENDKIRWDVGDHDLIGLFQKAGIKPAPGEKQILEILTDWAVWQGRYPVPMNATSHSNERTFPHRDLIEKCYLRLCAMLNG